MNNLINQMQQDAGATAPNSMGKIGAVANDIADTDKEISDIEKELKELNGLLGTKNINLCLLNVQVLNAF